MTRVDQVISGGGGYDHVSSTAPSDPDTGETWLDTSVDPPIGKVYADLGAGGQWTTDLLDDAVSNAGATDTDIRDGVWSDSTKAPGANVDAAISSRSSHSDPDPNGYIDQAISNAGKTATATDRMPQSDILSDATPFDGANIDAKISSVGGVDWSILSFETSASTVSSHNSNTYLDLIGSGYFMGVYSGIDNTFNIQFDGGNIYESAVFGSHAIQTPPIRFSSSIKVTSNKALASNRGVWVVVE